MPIIERTGDLFKEPDLDAIVVTVNCVGVMGAGLAKQAKEFSPEAFKTYRKKCSEQRFRPGYVVPIYTGKTPPLFLCAATKDHWKDPSKLEWVDNCLCVLEALLMAGAFKRIAMPHLGCGLGGLDRREVRVGIDHYLAHLDTEILLY